MVLKSLYNALTHSDTAWQRKNSSPDSSMAMQEATSLAEVEKIIRTGIAVVIQSIYL